MSKPSIHISPDDWYKMISYSTKTHEKYGSEVGGMAEVIRNDNEWWIKNPVILKQEVSATNTHIDKEALSLYLSKVGAENKDKLKTNEFLALWWHTHPTFGAKFSSADWDTIKEYSLHGNGLALVLNNDGDYQLVFTINEPVLTNIECKLSFAYKTYEHMDEEIDELCEKSEILNINRAYNTMAYSKRIGIGLPINASEDNGQLSLVDMAQYDKSYDIGEPPELTEEDKEALSYDAAEIRLEIDDLINEHKMGNIEYDDLADEIEKYNEISNETLIAFEIPQEDELANGMVRCSVDIELEGDKDSCVGL